MFVTGISTKEKRSRHCTDGSFIPFAFLPCKHEELGQNFHYKIITYLKIAIKIFFCIQCNTEFRYTAIRMHSKGKRNHSLKNNVYF